METPAAVSCRLRSPQAVAIDVGGIHLDLVERFRMAPRRGELGGEDGETVGLFTRGATGAPDPKRTGGRLPQRGQEPRSEALPGLHVAEEPGDVDRERVAQVLVLGRSAVEQALIVRVGVNSAGPHPNRDPPADALGLVGLYGKAAALRDSPGERLKREIVGGAGHEARSSMSRLARAS